eukprot:977472-Pelagomonas_calceolata.AAC.4
MDHSWLKPARAPNVEQICIIAFMLVPIPLKKVRNGCIASNLTLTHLKSLILTFMKAVVSNKSPFGSLHQSLHTEFPQPPPRAVPPALYTLLKPCFDKSPEHERNNSSDAQCPC